MVWLVTSRLHLPCGASSASDLYNHVNICIYTYFRLKKIASDRRKPMHVSVICVPAFPRVCARLSRVARWMLQLHLLLTAESMNNDGVVFHARLDYHKEWMVGCHVHKRPVRPPPPVASWTGLHLSVMPCTLNVRQFW